MTDIHLRVGYYDTEGRLNRADYTGQLEDVPEQVKKLAETAELKGYTDLTIVINGLTKSRQKVEPEEDVADAGIVQEDAPPPEYDWTKDSGENA